MTERTVYGVSVDSRSRNVDEPDNKYTIQLFHTLNRVKTVQLGSFQFTDDRYAFNPGAQLKYSEPLTIPPNTYLRFEETVATFTKETRTQTSTVRRVAILLPPTINPITGVVGNLVTTAYDTGLLFGATYYPETGMRMSVVGADFPQDLAAFTTPTFPTDAGPLLTSATTVAPYVTTTANSFTYTANYLSELSGGVGSTALRHFRAGAYTSYVHAPKPTLVELFIMLNAATTALTTRTDITDTITNATNATPIVVTTTASNGLVTGDEVVISGVLGNTAANGTFLIVSVNASSFQLVGSAGNGAYGGGGTLFSPQQLNVPATFGFDNSNNAVVCHAPTRVVDTPRTIITRKLRLVDSLAALVGFNNVNLDPAAIASVPATLIRPVNLKAGTLLASEIRDNTAFRLNAGDFTDATRASDRTLYFIMPVGIADTVVLDYGCYSGTQLAAYLTSALNPAPNQITVVYNAFNGTFTFAHDIGLSFGLDFARASQLMRERMGFDALVYTGASSYTSVRPAVFGVSAAATFPANKYALVADETTRHFTFRAEAPIMLHAVSGTSTTNVGAAWYPLADNLLPFAHHFQAGDVLTAKRPTLSSTQAGAKAINAATNATPIAITTAAAHGLATGDVVTIQFVRGNTAANGTWTVTVTGGATFTLDGSVGNGSYNAPTGEWWTNVSLVTGTQKASAIFTVVVQSVWDASTATPLLTLEPTASIFSTQDAGTASRESLGTPSDTDGRVILTSAQRNVFMLHLEHPEGSPSTFGFPAVAWPPSEKVTLSATGNAGIATLRGLPEYDAATLSIPVSGSYTSPFSWNLLPPDYIVIVLRVTCASSDIHTHSYRGTSFPIFAKLLITFPYISVSDEMMFTTFAGHARFKCLGIEFQNPDGTPVQFNGRPHTFTLLFTVEENGTALPCL
jgi:hypothetical protein